MSSISFLRMKNESGEKRVFLPDFIQFLALRGVHVYLEDGYGSRSGFTMDEYMRGQTTVSFTSRENCYQKDYVVILRSPRMSEYEFLGENSCLISMLHFPTRPRRINKLKTMTRRAISMDSIVNDQNQRLVENMKAVAWNGLEVAFDQLEHKLAGLQKPDNSPIRVLVIGTGMVGRHALDAATKLGNVERNNEYMMKPGGVAIAQALGRSATSHPEIFKEFLQQADILVDAAQRRDTSVALIPNDWIGLLPEHAVIVDLSVDPYTMEIHPPVVRGIEGIPQGNLDKYIFQPEDADWTNTIPEGIPCSCRRTTVTCYSWPGIHPEASMVHYAHQLEPLMESLLKCGYDCLSLDGDYFQRALYRASLNAW